MADIAREADLDEELRQNAFAAISSERRFWARFSARFRVRLGADTCLGSGPGPSGWSRPFDPPHGTGPLTRTALRFYARTDVGRVREHNEDNFLVDKKLSLFIVADGMGGHAAGEVASAIAVRTVHEEIQERARPHRATSSPARAGALEVTNKDILALLEHAVQRACARIHEEAQADPAKRGMGTTLSRSSSSARTASSPTSATAASTCCAAGAVQQVTEDHTVFNELIKRGKLTREQIEKVAQRTPSRARSASTSASRSTRCIIEVAPRRPVPPRSRRPPRVHRRHRTSSTVLRCATTADAAAQGAHRARQRARRQRQHHRDRRGDSRF